MSLLVRHAFSDSIPFFVFQAEDGIRDLVRSRGLGDVYKRQDHGSLLFGFWYKQILHQSPIQKCTLGCYTNSPESVSYTHLTLPTSDLV
mgnify:CR=1 FL=1